MRPVILFLAVLFGAWAAQVVRPEAVLPLPGPPWHWPLILAPVVIALLAGALRPTNAVVAGLASARLAIAALLAVAATCWPIAVFPPGAAAPAWLARIGLGEPLSGLPFAVALLAVLLNLATALGRRLRVGPGRLRFAVLHGGLLIAIVGGAAGHAGLIRARFALEEGGAPIAVAADEAGRSVRLPLALRLDDFVLERFPPMLLLATPDGRVRRGEVLLGPGVEERLAGLQVRVVEWLPAVAVLAEAPVAFRDPAANPAARVEVRDATGALLGGGWLHPASTVGAALFLALPDGRTLHLETPRPRRFLARVRLGGTAHEITVNRPLRAAGWAVYLLSYDEALGPASRHAIFEAVEDRALPAVYAGIVLLLAGVLLHLWRPRPAGAQA